MLKHLGISALLGSCALSSSVWAAAPAAPNLGPNVIVFDPSMPVSQIQAKVNSIYAQQVDNEMGSQRYALLFKPGVYGSAANPLIVPVGYYTDVAGLGALPTDVTINGHVDVYNRCLSADNCIALNNFWRSMSNLTINVTGLSDCRSSGNFWAVSQAAPMRRVKVNGNLTLMDYCTAGPQYASGGFIADSMAQLVINGSQQQFIVRNSSVTNWTNGVWNQVFSGVQGAPAQSFAAQPTTAQPYTTLATSPITREKPYLFIDATGQYKVYVPATQRNSVGTSWANGQQAGGNTLPMSRFYITSATDTAQSMNNALSRGLNLLLTPGVYHLKSSLKVKRPDTVILGLGFPTLIPDEGNMAIQTANVPGVELSGLLIDAGPKVSPVLVKVGSSHGRDDEDRDMDEGWANTSADDYTALHDVFVRIGGATAGKAKTAIVVNSSNVILDDIWSWRADHGNANTVGWTLNTADTGLIVNGDNVTAYGLFVEHYQKYNVIWNGEHGKTIFFQNELPYDPPNQAAWTQADGTLGWAAYKVSNHVNFHEAWGMGSYCFFNIDPTIHAARGFEVPDTPGVKLHDMLTVSLSNSGTIDHVVNNVGAAAQGAVTVPVNVVSYP